MLGVGFPLKGRRSPLRSTIRRENDVGVLTSPVWQPSGGEFHMLNSCHFLGKCYTKKKKTQITLSERESVRERVRAKLSRDFATNIKQVDELTAPLQHLAKDGC